MRLSPLQALTIANLVCSLPSAVLSLIDKSPITWLTFVVLVQIHAILLGLPLFSLLTSRGWANRVTSAISGVIVGALPMGLILSSMSGPGVRLGETVSIGALSGLAVGFLSYLLVAKQSARVEVRSRTVEQPERKAQPSQVPVTMKTSAGNPLLIKDPIIGFINLFGNEGLALAQTDRSNIASVFSTASKIETERFPRCNVLFIYGEIEPSGRVSGRPYSLRDIIRASGAYIAVVASNTSPSVLSSKEFGEYLKRKNDWPANIVITVDRNGDQFGKFFKALFVEMNAGATMPSAWVKLAPQGPSMNADNPGTLVLLEAGHIAFASSKK